MEAYTIKFPPLIRRRFPTGRSASPADARSPLITVILTTCDRPALLKRAVASVVAQGDTPWALVIVNDGRSDVAHPISHDERISHARTGGRIGVAEARNLGMRQAESDWMVFLDDDDEMEPGYIAHFCEHFSDHLSQPALVLADWRILDYAAEGGVERERRRTYDMLPGPSQQNIQQALRAGACGLAINRRALASGGPMDPSYRLTEDTEWILRLIQVGCEILYAPGPGFIIHNRRSTDQLSNERHFADRIAECRRLQARYGDLGGRFPNLAGMFDGLIASYEGRRDDKLTRSLPGPV